jgi:hypothetical protein
MKIAAIAMILGIAAAYAGKDPVAVPQYDPKTESSFTATIVKVSEVTGALDGVFIKVETKAESYDVYVAPANFVKMLEIPLKVGLNLEITASLVPYDGNKVMLARDLRIGKNLYSLRDKNGIPNWMWLTKANAPTGF